MYDFSGLINLKKFFGMNNAHVLVMDGSVTYMLRVMCVCVCLCASHLIRTDHIHYIE